MTASLLVTGGTGLAGSNVAVKASERGWTVRVLVRSDVGLDKFREQGIDVAVGDVTDPSSLDRAMEGITRVVHAAATLAGTWTKATPETLWSVNHQGGLNVLDAAARAGVDHTVLIDTQGIFDPAFTMTERSPVVEITGNDSPYIAAKRACYFGALHRAALGQQISFVTPGCIYGPGPFVERALDQTTFTSIVQRALNGEITSYLTFPLYWTYVQDLAEICLRVAERGEAGRRYLAIGRNEEVSSMADFCNEAATIAGVQTRMDEIDPASSDGPDIGTMKQFALRTFARPYLDNSATTAALNYAPTPRAEAIRATVTWLKENDKIYQ